MKRIVCIVLACILLVTLAACNKAGETVSVLSSKDADTHNTATASTKETEKKTTDPQKTDQVTKAEQIKTTGKETEETIAAQSHKTQKTSTKKTRATTTKKTLATVTKKTLATTAPKTASSMAAEMVSDPKQLKADGLLLTQGRVTTVGGGLSLPYSDAGITICGELEGAVILVLTLGDKGCVINVVVDGDTENVETMRLSGGVQTVTACAGLKKGLHTVEITRGTASNYGSVVLNAVYYDGTLKAPTAKALQLEFIGDSVTCSEGSIKSGGYSVDGHNSFYGYAALTARALNAGLATEAVCGIKTAGMRTRFNDSSWDFANNPKDIVVINLGTNDIGWPGSSVPASFKSDVQGMIGDVRARYGKDTYIVWAYGMMFDNNKAAVKSAVEEYVTDNNDTRVLFCDMSAAKDTSGYGSHPSAEGHETAAKLLTQYIKQNCNI